MPSRVQTLALFAAAAMSSVAAPTQAMGQPAGAADSGPVVPARSSAAQAGSVHPAPDPINAIVGDASWVARFGRAPNDGDSEEARIRTHLDWVVAHLSGADVSHLDQDARVQRRSLLSELVAYSKSGQFPHHTGAATRRPRFVDERGNHCAVGHLMRYSGRADLVSAIQQEHEYDLIHDIQVPGVVEWAAASGLSLDELAMIQPAYHPAPNDGGQGGPTRTDNRAVRPRVQIRAGEGVDQGALRQILQRYSGRLQRCHEVQLRSIPDWAGRMEFELEVQPGGRTVATPVHVVEGPVSPCARQVLTRMRVPTETPLSFRVLLDYSGPRSASRPTLSRSALVEMLDSLRARVETCTRRAHRDTQVHLWVRAQSSGAVTLRVRTSPRSREMDRCVEIVLADLVAQVQSEFSVSSTVRARRVWNVERASALSPLERALAEAEADGVETRR